VCCGPPKQQQQQLLWVLLAAPDDLEFLRRVYRPQLSRPLQEPLKAVQALLGAARGLQVDGACSSARWRRRHGGDNRTGSRHGLRQACARGASSSSGGAEVVCCGGMQPVEDGKDCAAAAAGPGPVAAAGGRVGGPAASSTLQTLYAALQVIGMLVLMYLMLDLNSRGGEGPAAGAGAAERDGVCHRVCSE